MLFLNGGNETVLRVHGNRSVQDFYYSVDYVYERADSATGLADYLEQRAQLWCTRCASIRTSSGPRIRPRFRTNR